MVWSLRVLLLCRLILETWSQTRSQPWSLQVPEEVVGLGLSCVLLPCSFSVPQEFEEVLDQSCRAVWKRGGWSRTLVYDSGSEPGLNLVQGSLTGDLVQRDCSTVLYGLPLHYDRYFFRLDCGDRLKYSFEPGLLLTIKDALPRPSLSPSRLEVEEGAPVTLSCSAVAPCPSEAPVLRWSLVPGAAVEEEVLKAGSVTSILKFTASHLHHGVTVSCSAIYRREAGTTPLLYDNSLTLHVLYPPQKPFVLGPSPSPSPSPGPGPGPGPVMEGDLVPLSCRADANPPVDRVTWFSVGRDHVTVLGSTQNYTTVASETHNAFFCQLGRTVPSQRHACGAGPPRGRGGGQLCVSALCDPLQPPLSRVLWFRDGVQQEQVRGAVLVWETAEHSHSGSYHCEVTTPLGQASSAPLQLDVQYAPRRTAVSSAPSGQVEDGSVVTLSCSTDANPLTVTFSWYRESAGLRTRVGHGPDLMVQVSRLSDQRFYCGARNDHGADFSPSLLIDVTFPPQILPSSRCVTVLSQVRCSCLSLGNPGPQLQWEVSGERVTHSALTPISSDRLSHVRVRSIITLHALQRDMPSLTCLSTNPLGTKTLDYHLSSSTPQLGFHPVSVAVGAAAGAMAVSVLCLFFFFFCCRKICRVSYKKKREENCPESGNDVHCKVPEPQEREPQEREPQEREPQEREPQEREPQEREGERDPPEKDPQERPSGERP